MSTGILLTLLLHTLLCVISVKPASVLHLHKYNNEVRSNSTDTLVDLFLVKSNHLLLSSFASSTGISLTLLLHTLPCVISVKPASVSHLHKYNNEVRSNSTDTPVDLFLVKSNHLFSSSFAS